MIGKLIEGTIKRRIVVFIVLIAIVVCGLACYNTLPKTSFPKIDIPMATITTIYPGATPEEVEKEVTKKVEDRIMSVTGYKESSSQSLNNASAVTISFDRKMSQDALNDACVELRRKMSELKDELPSGVMSISVDTNSMDCASLVVAISAEGIVSNDDLSLHATELKDELKKIDGVSQVKIMGNNDSEVSVKVDAEKLNHLDLSLYEVTQIIAANNALLPIGNMSVGESEISVTTSGRYEDVDAIKNIIITGTENGGLLHLSDIAEVELREPEDSSYFTYNGKKSVLVALYFKNDLNVVSKGSETRKILDDFAETLADEFSVNEVYFQSDDVSDDINNFIVSLIESIIIVMVVVMIGMGKRNGMIVSIAIPIIIFITFLMMKLLDVQIHFISLASLIMVLGMLVDNSIVISDSIQTRLNQGMERMDACKQGVKDVIVSVFISMITTVTVFASMLTLTGTYKQVASAIPYIAIISMVASFLVSIISTPVFCYLFLKPVKVDEDKEETATQKAKKAKISEVLYKRLFNYAFAHKKQTLCAVLAFLLLMSISLPFMTMELLPKTNKPYILINVTNHNQNNIKETEKIMKHIEEVVTAQPEVENCVMGVGICLPRFNFSVISRGETDSNGDICAKINLKDSKRFKKTADMVNFLQDEFDSTMSGADIVVDELGMIPSTEPPVSIYVKGNNMEDVNSVSSQAAAVLKDIKGIKGVSNDSSYATYGYYVDMDDNKLTSYGLTRQEVQNELSLAISGRTASVFYNNGKGLDINVKTELDSTEDLYNYKIKSSGGNKYLVKQFADLKSNSVSNTIKHVNNVRGALVGGYPKSGYSAQDLQTEYMKKLDSLDLPEGVTIEMRGEKHESEEAMSGIMVAGLISIIIVFMILYLQFGRFRQVFLLFASLPLGAVMGMCILTICGIPVSFFCMLGILSMLGIVLANAIVLVDFINNERKNGASIDEACKIAGEKRISPILMSTMTTVLGLVPLAISGQTLFVGMAILLMAALTICMIFNLVMVPLMYSMIEKEDK